MPRFFFHLDDGLALLDEEGADLPSLDSARAVAARYLGQSLADAPDAFWRNTDWRLTVSNESGVAMFTVQIVASETPALVARLPEPD